MLKILVVNDVFPHINNRTTILFRNIIPILSKKFECDPRTIENRINDLIKGTGLNDLGYGLKKQKIGKEKYFELKKIIPENKQEEIF